MAQKAIARIPIEEFRRKRGAIKAFQKRNGKIGAVILFGALAHASLALKRSYRQVEKLALADPVAQAGSRMDLNEGFHMLHGPAREAGRFIAVESLQLTNKTEESVVVILEPKDLEGSSLGFSFVPLEPGKSYTQTSSPASVVFAVVVGARKGGLVAQISGAAIVKAPASCHLERNFFVRNVCVGPPCPDPTETCQWDAAGPFWIFGEDDPTHCGCH